MNVANADWVTPRCSSSSCSVKPSNSRLPPPSTTGATRCRAGRRVRVERLADHVGAALTLTSLRRPPPCTLIASASPSTKTKSDALRLFLRTMGDDEERRPPGWCHPSGAPPRTSRDRRPRRRSRAASSSHSVSPLGTPRGSLVRPRAAEHPVVEPLAALPEALARPVVGPGDVAVDRCRDARDHAHSTGYGATSSELIGYFGIDPIVALADNSDIPRAPSAPGLG